MLGVGEKSLRDSGEWVEAGEQLGMVGRAVWLRAEKVAPAWGHRAGGQERPQVAGWSGGDSLDFGWSLAAWVQIPDLPVRN